MYHLGEIQKDSVILLELLTIRKNKRPIQVDNQPTATIGLIEQNGVIQVDNVKLETMEEGSRYSKNYTIPEGLKPGNYIITYELTSEQKTYETKQSFTLVEAKTSYARSFRVEDVIDTPIEEVVSDIKDYVLPSDYQISSAVKVDKNKLVISLSGNASYNQTYQIVLGKGIRSIEGHSLETEKTLTYTSEYSPLYATPLEIQGVLRSIYKYFQPHDVYIAIRDSSQKALQMLGKVADVNSARFREIRSTDSVLFPLQKFVLYESARVLMTKLMIRILSGADEEESNAGDGMISQSGGSMTLGDFAVSDTSSSSTGVGSSSSDSEESPLQKLQALLAQNDKEIKFWQDSMKGQNNRGYGKPATASYRGSAGSPTGRDF